MRARVSHEFQARFSSAAIDLDAPKAGSNLELYEAGHSFGVVYSATAPPSERDVRADLIAMLELYGLLRNRGGMDELEIGPEPAEAATPGGKLEEARRRRLHERVERNPTLARAAKDFHGYVCQVCNFDFGEAYGSLGKNYIIAHHKTPLAELAAAGPVALSPVEDFAVVCANCHAMIHAKGSPTTFDEFVARFRDLRR
jgi:5-methylcytosine-specific restriction protein A